MHSYQDEASYSSGFQDSAASSPHTFVDESYTTMDRSGSSPRTSTVHIVRQAVHGESLQHMRWWRREHVGCVQSPWAAPHAGRCHAASTILREPLHVESALPPMSVVGCSPHTGCASSTGQTWRAPPHAHVAPSVSYHGLLHTFHGTSTACCASRECLSLL